jgi:hypothetical protein
MTTFLRIDPDMLLQIGNDFKEREWVFPTQRPALYQRSRWPT